MTEYLKWRLTVKILLTEDEVSLGKSIKARLQLDGYVVDWIQDGVSSENAALNFEYDAIIMDINLPRKNGIAVIKALRQKKCHTPILVLTANNSTQDCINGLSHGADDYLTKPFEYDEIRERLKALIRRERRTFLPQLQYRDLVLDSRSHQLYQGKDTIIITQNEYRVLEMLMADPTRVISVERLMENIYGWDDSIGSNTIQVYIHHLRKKIGNDYIKTIRNVGYRMG